MPVVTRNQIAAALFALVDDAVGAVVGLETSSRKYRGPQEVDPTEMPALFQIQTVEDYERFALGTPPKRTMHFEICLYTSDAQEDSVIPSEQLNDMIDAVEAAFAPDASTGLFTLGGLVFSARIDGKIEYLENLVGDGKSAAAIQVAVLRP